MSNENTLYVHIGLHKTGTTSLQAFLYDNREKLIDEGYSYIDLHRAVTHCEAYRDRCYEQNGDVLLLPDFMIDDSAENWKKAMKCIRKELEHRNVILSAEDLSRNYKKLLKCLKKEIQRVYVIVYLRRQDLWIESNYAKQIKTGSLSVGFKEYLDKELVGWRLENLNYYQLLSNIESILGEGHVIPRVFEHSQLVGGSIESDFLSCLGIDYDGWESTRRRLNERLSGEYLEIKKIVNSTYCIQAPTTKYMLREIIEGLSREYGLKEYKEHFFSIDDRKTIIDRYRYENEETAKMFFGRSDGRLFYDAVEDKYVNDNKCGTETDLYEIIRFFSAWMINIDNRMARLENQIWFDIVNKARKRKILVYGAGNNCRHMLDTLWKRGIELDISVIIDNDAQKSGQYIYGYPVVSPKTIDNWGVYFVIITPIDSEVIEAELLDKGLLAGEDFITVANVLM